MSVTKSQKVWFGLLGIGVCALVADQWTNGTAALEAANETPSADVAGDTLPAAAGDVGGAGKPLSLAARLTSLAAGDRAGGDVRDAFAASPAWVRVEEPTTPTPVPVDFAGEFRRSHKLKAIFQSDGTDRALIDGELLSVGQSLDGFKLIAVGRLRATFARGEVRAELALQDAALAGPAARPVAAAGSPERQEVNSPAHAVDTQSVSVTSTQE